MKKILIVSAGLNVVLAGVCLVSVSRSADSEGAVAEVAPVEREVEMASRTEVFPVEAGEEEKADLGRKFPDLRGLDHNGQVAALVAEGWPEEDAKLYALGRLMQIGRAH